MIVAAERTGLRFMCVCVVGCVPACLSPWIMPVLLYQPSAEKMSLWPVFQNFRISGK